MIEWQVPPQKPDKGVFLPKEAPEHNRKVANRGKREENESNFSYFNNLSRLLRFLLQEPSGKTFS